MSTSPVTRGSNQALTAWPPIKTYSTVDSSSSRSSESTHELTIAFRNGHHWHGSSGGRRRRWPPFTTSACVGAVFSQVSKVESVPL